MHQVKTAIDLLIGEIGILKSFSNQIIAPKFLELGCLPGAKITLINVAPFRSTYFFKINKSRFALRKAEAENLILEL